MTVGARAPSAELRPAAWTLERDRWRPYARRSIYFMIKTLCLALACSALLLATPAHAELLGSGAAGDFPLAVNGSAAPFLIASDDGPVARAADDLRADIERVTGVRPSIEREETHAVLPALVVIGIDGQSAAIDQLVAAKKIDLTALRGAWESYVIAVVRQPFPGVAEALVVVGSDRRGAIYGCYEVSQSIGVSPWYWWADVAPEHRDALYIVGGQQRFGPPSVKYRGIFINDEDWGLQPWAAKTFEPEHGDIGPKTYAKVFELMLRLKANTVWPAMHACTKAFNAFAENKGVADRYGIVMGSSHAEPMLRNNVSEWTGDHDKYNYVTNREGVRAYWEQRVKENGRYENIYTLGMRGIHDSGMQGAKTDPERIRVLEQVFADQRALLAKYARPAAPQMFCAYKEVLELYRGGLHVPDDVTIVWPDDNFGYIRNFASAQERQRRGGFGVYYHLSYLGAPLSYLWLCTTPPALVWEEMTKAYDHGARTIWIANVGDIKPAEIATDFFFQLAWDVTRWPRETLPQFLPIWAARDFGAESAPAIAAIMQEYYRLNFQRKPEHLQWWLPGTAPRPSPFIQSEIDERLQAFAALRQRVQAVEATVSRARRDAFFELVAYPVLGSALANERYFAGELARSQAAEPAARDGWLQRATAADAELRALTQRYDEEVAGGKWHRLMSLEPADDQWSSMRIARWRPPAFDVNPPPPADAAEVERPVVVEAEHFASRANRGGAGWEIVPSLGRSGDGAVAVYPTTMGEIAADKLATDAPRLDYDISLPLDGDHTLRVNFLPTQPIRTGRGLRCGIAIDDDAPREVVADVVDGSPAWAQSVLAATVVAEIPVRTAKGGRHSLHLYAIDPGVVVDRIVIYRGKLPPSYLGPTESNSAARSAQHPLAFAKR